MSAESLFTQICEYYYFSEKEQNFIFFFLDLKF